jgi:hypothetical protein
MLNFDLQRIKPTQDIQVCSSLARAEVALAVSSLRATVAAPSAGAVLAVVLSSSPSPRSSDDHHHYPYVPFSRLKQLSSPRCFLGQLPAGGDTIQIRKSTSPRPAVISDRSPRLSRCSIGRVLAVCTSGMIVAAFGSSRTATARRP